ncbi:transport protein TonB [Rubripirellula lacrimiformis]|uniref:Transport protein TonB n=1 Tax=Rubripirellula lacrimiformis TaxID=1930273 RepID=A0A517NCT5_9BACT|nr:energy transducer TonB [Rubripirellula lacrimiformis]QDT04940.1 transport protein TonB [Rubripirellula lacrimiformis]
MIHSSHFRRSTAFSLALHATALVAMCCVSLSALERFSSGGPRQVVSIEVSLARPAATAVSTPVSFEAIEPVTQSDHDLSRPLPVQRRTPTRSVLSSDLPEPDWTPATISQPLERVVTRTQQPIVRPAETDRPRLPPVVAVSIAPAASVPPTQQMTGLRDDSPVEFTDTPAPKYPNDAIVRRLQGTVMLKLFISTVGEVERVEISDSSGHAVLDQAAVSAVMMWRGKPATRFGQPIASVEVLPIRFRL